MIRRLVALVIVLALVYAGWHVGVVWSHYRKFQDDVRNVALFGNDKTDDDLKSIYAYLRTIKPISNHVPDAHAADAQTH